MSKCPICGFDADIKKYNPGAQIRSLLTKRNKRARRLLREVSSTIQTSVPSDNTQYKYYTFLQSISRISDDIVNWSIGRFIIDNHASNTRGFTYLRGIIFNENKNRKKRLEDEYARVGKPPSIKKIKETNNG